nr:hypothetical protein [Streptomyces sp. HNM0575]
MLLLATAVSAAAVAGTALHSARGLRRRLDECARGAREAKVPHARSAEEIHSIVAEAIAEERERELAEARAVWAAQESRAGGADDEATLAGRGTEYEVASVLDALLRGRVDDDVLRSLRELRDGDGDGTGDHTGMPGPGVFVPRQTGRDIEPMDHADLTDLTDLTDHGDLDRRADFTESAPPAPPADHGATDRAPDPGVPDGGQDHQHPGVTAARRRHPSEPDFTLHGDPVAPAQPPRARSRAGHEQTVGRLAELADARTPLSDVRQGPLGTLDVYLFQDGTTVCLSPGHRETAEALCEALRAGDVPVLMGGSTVSGAYALTFAYGEGRTAYLLADRVIASR